MKAQVCDGTRGSSSYVFVQHEVEAGAVLLPGGLLMAWD